MATKKDYINLIRWSCIIDSFNSNYFIRIIVLYLLSQNVTLGLQYQFLLY